MTLNKDKTCEIEGCDKTVLAKNLCARHYKKIWRGADPLVDARFNGLSKRTYNKAVDNQKRCPICNEVKDREHFFITKKGKWDSYCKPCKRDYYRARNIAKRLANPPAPRQPRVMPDCIGPECDRVAEHYAGSDETMPVCGSHYTQWYLGRPLTPLLEYRKSYISDAVRRCTACDEVKPSAAFYKHSRTGALQTECRVCMVQRSKFNQALRKGQRAFALSLTESMPERMKKKALERWANANDEIELERSNDKETEQA